MGVARFETAGSVKGVTALLVEVTTRALQWNGMGTAWGRHLPRGERPQGGFDTHVGQRVPGAQLWNRNQAILAATTLNSSRT